MKWSELLIFSLAFAACSPTARDDSRQLLMVSVEPQRQVLEELAGPAFTVETMLSRGADPETFEPAPSARMRADDASLYFATGVLPFEEALKQSVGASTRFIDTSRGIDLIYGTHGHDHHGHGHDHGAPDPHYWSSVSGIRTMAHNMAAALSEQLPDSADVISRRLAGIDARLDSLDSALRSRLSAQSGKAFAVWHPSLSYFARDYGLRQISVGLEGKEMSAGRLAATVDSAKAAGVEVFFFQQGYDNRRADAVNGGIGSRLVIINPLDYDWVGQLTNIADELAR